MTRLTLKDIKFYKTNGYLVIKNCLNNFQVNKIKNRLEELEKKQSKSRRGLSEPGISKSLVHSLHKDNLLNKLIFNQKWYLSICQKIINTKKIITWNCKANLKKKWHGSAEYYHQDFEYWRSYGFKNPKMMSCMIFVDDHSHYNGGMWVFPKSHKKHYKHEKFLNINSLQKNLIPTKTLNKLAKKNKPIQISEKSGSCLFFDCRLVHGSSHNISDFDRRIVLAQIGKYNDFLKVDTGRIDTQNGERRKEYEYKELKKRLMAIHN